MIKSKEDYLYYLEQDKKALKVTSPYGIVGFVKEVLFPHYIWHFERLMRKLEYVQNVQMKSSNKLLRILGG